MVQVMMTSAGVCRLCGGPAESWVRYDITAFQPSWRQRGVDPMVEIARCVTHGSWFTLTVPDPAALASQYQTSSATEYYEDENRSPGRRNQRLLQQLQGAVPRGARVIDVGGGDGSFAVQAARAGYDSTLLEIGDLDRTRLDEAGVRLTSAFTDADAGQFDAVTLWDVYEHVWPHAEFLAPIRTALRPRGRLLIEVPSPSNLVWPFLAMGAALPSPRREIAWSHVVSFTHVQLMTPSELRATLQGHGFQVVALQTSSELAYRGVEYAQRIVPFAPLARAVGAVFDHPVARRHLLGHNKTFLVAEKV